ncbi:hypothetical protein N9802_07995 [Amylibacter sp.]|nr:hypothetical protein [Amylibacter sp.]
MTILLLTISSAEYGLGHLSRSQNLATSIRANKHEVILIDIYKNQEFTFYNGSKRTVKLQFKKIKKSGVKKIIVDLPFQISIDELENFLGSFDLYGIDDISDKRLYYTKIFYPYVGNPHNLIWDLRSSVKTFCGSKYAILNPYLDQLKRNRKIKTEGVLVSFGGSDPCNLRHVFLTSDIPLSYEFTLNLGPLILEEKRQPDLNVKIVRSTTSKQFLDLLSVHSKIICSFGVTVYEALSLKKQVIAVCLSPDHLRSAKKISETYENFSFVEKRDFLNNPAIIFDLLDTFSGKYSEWPNSDYVNIECVKEICE